MKTETVGNSKSFSAKLKLITFNDLISLVKYITYTETTEYYEMLKIY